MIASLLLSTIGLAAPSRTAKKKGLLKRKHSLQSQIVKKRQQIHIIRTQARETKQKLVATDRHLSIARGILNFATTQYERKQFELHRANRALSAAKAEYSNAREDTSVRLVAMYERGKPGYAELLLSSDDFADLLQRAQLAKLMMERDRDALVDLRQVKEKVARRQDVVEEKTREVAEWKQQVAVITQRTAQKKVAVAHDLNKQRAQVDDLEAELAALERDSNAVTSMLQLLQRSGEGRRRFNTHYVGSLGGGGLPVNGRITSGFGYRYHPILHSTRLHTGVDIAAPIGTPIAAAGGGEVIWAGWRGGYGNAVIIDHGHGRATLYGHMSRLGVRAGQVVSRRQLIGYVGSTGMSTGPHLHFELRVNGVPRSPL